MKNPLFPIVIFLSVFLLSCSGKQKEEKIKAFPDQPFIQNYSIKYQAGEECGELKWVGCDRNGSVQLFSTQGLLRPRNGQFLFPGTLVADLQDRQVSDRNIAGTTLFNKQFVYLDDKLVFSHSAGGNLFLNHTLPGAFLLAGSKDSLFLVSDGTKMVLTGKSGNLWEGFLPGERIRDIRYEPTSGIFCILGDFSIYSFSPGQSVLKEIVRDSSLTCFAVSENGIIAGTDNGYYETGIAGGKMAGEVCRRMPWTELTAVEIIGGKVWFGSTRGAMMLREDGQFDYYASKRWIPSDTVLHLAQGPGNSVLILTPAGLGNIIFEEMTLAEKAMLFERQVRERHIRHGLNATLASMTDGDVTTGSLEDSDNDGLWTSMYLAAETFRYAVTRSDEALRNVRESLEAMERLYTVNGLNSGFPSRSYIRRGYKYDDPAWRRAGDPEWDWKSTTSSDEAIGHIFAFGVIAELVDEPTIRDKAVLLIDTLMSHILKNEFYLIDWDGNPTRWGRWNPEYVNGFPEMVGDRKLNSSNITAMLQTAWHFTGKEKYREAIHYLFREHGYLENLMRPMGKIGVAAGEAGELSQLLSESWNHSDDEMYYCGYWGLYRYALNDTLRAKYRESILDHWKAESPEKEGLWNIMTALTGASGTGIEEALWYLREYPLDLVDWTIVNSHRKDVDHLDPNFRNQTIKEVLPPDELPVSRHNANRFKLDDRGEGRSEFSAGDIWLLPYWMGRYLGVISG